MKPDITDILTILGLLMVATGLGLLNLYLLIVLAGVVLFAIGLARR